jgi:hypothetical protein
MFYLVFSCPDTSLGFSRNLIILDTFLGCKNLIWYLPDFFNVKNESALKTA